MVKRVLRLPNPYRVNRSSTAPVDILLRRERGKEKKARRKECVECFVSTFPPSPAPPVRLATFFFFWPAQRPIEPNNSSFLPFPHSSSIRIQCRVLHPGSASGTAARGGSLHMRRPHLGPKTRSFSGSPGRSYKSMRGEGRGKLD